MSSLAVGILSAFCCGLALVWSRNLDIPRGICAAICRFIWVLPIVLSLEPEVKTTILPATLSQQPIHILIDDSLSMQQSRFNPKTFRNVVEKSCLQYGCIPKISTLSDLHPKTAKGWTPLSSVLEPWLFKTGSEPWILVTDGADWRPAEAWDDRLNDRGHKVKGKHLGLILGYGKPQSPAFWMDNIGVQGFAFEGKSVTVSAKVGRADTQTATNIQVQLLVDGQPVTAGQVSFASASETAEAELSFASPGRGLHLVTLKALPVSGEKDTWDNELHTYLEVMPNTIGILHLLGAPSWDGRFLRRYFKAEPKFDLISFFILRDPWDNQQISERELSLIPFPVERLFREELANFKVLVIQNFTMLQFLQQEYQENLVKFVREGGGLLFIGGSRALTEADMQNSPFAEMMPFTLEAGHPPQQSGMFFPTQSLGHTYDESTRFKIEFASPPSEKRALANIYDDWEHMSERLSALKNLKGLHRMNQFKLKSQEVTPLLDARQEDGKKVPLAVASYPGKGRAIWIFTDSLWKLAMSDDANHSRFDYRQFFDNAMTWLMRHERRAPLTAKDFTVHADTENGKVRWNVRLVGPAAKYLDSRDGTWSVHICGRSVTTDAMQSEQISTDVWKATGEISFAARGGAVCSFSVDWSHPAFGHVKTSANAVFADTIEDVNSSPSPRKLSKLAHLTGASYHTEEDDQMRTLDDWLRSWTGAHDVSQPERRKTIRDFYWPMNRPWIWLCLLALPMEILTRRWHQLFGNKP